MRDRIPRASRLTLGACVVLALALASVASCSKKSTDVSISVAACPPIAECPFPTLDGIAASAEFDIFPGGCPAEHDLELGTFGSATFTQTVPCVGGGAGGASSALPNVCGDIAAPGDLPIDTYGFALLLRDDQCRTFAFGCVTVDLKKVRTVTIPVDGIYTDETKTMLARVDLCSGQSCVAGICGGDGAGGSTSAGAGGSSGAGTGGSAGGGTAGKGGAGGGTTGCSLELLAHGKLPDPETAGDTVAGPGVVSTGSGFIAGYEDISSDGSKARLALLPIGMNGELGNPSTAELQGCAGAAFDGGLGMTFIDASHGGVVAVSRPPCAADPDHPNNAGIVLAPFSAGGQLGGALLLKGTSTTFPAISVASQHALAKVPGMPAARVSFVQSQTAYSFDVMDLAPTTQYLPIFPGSMSMFAVSASSESVFTTVADGTGDGGKILDVMVRPAGGAAATVTRDAATMAATTAFGERTLLATRDAMGNIGWALLGKDGATLASSTLAGVPAKGFDVAAVSDRLVFVAGKALGLHLVTIKGALEMPSMAPEKSPVLDASMIPELSSFDGAQVAMAADMGRVAVVWTSRATLGATDPSGGFAIFRCEP